MSSKTSYSLLLIEDNISDFRRIETLLAEIPGTRYRLRRVGTAEEAQQAAFPSNGAPHGASTPNDAPHGASTPNDASTPNEASNSTAGGAFHGEPPDLCLVGTFADGTQGIAFIAAHSGDLEFPPLILLTERPDPRADQAALEAGAMDYLHKSDLTPGLLERAIRHSVARQKARRELVTLATTDPLTGVYNRKTLYDRGNQEFDRATRYGHPLSLLLIDIDHFKYVNESFGHDVGDKVLHALVAAILAAIRETDFFGRFGGGEFLLILPHTDRKGAERLADRIKTAMKTQPVMDNGTVIEVSISCGVCTTSDQMEFFDELVVCADRALYQNKSQDAAPD